MSHYESDLTNNEIQRYLRQIILPQVNIDGQIKLRKSRVLIIGMGGLGSPVLMYLASAGVGIIGIMDYDIIEIHNLQRQVIHSEKNLNISKTESAMQFAKNLNSSINIVKHKGFITDENINGIVVKYDIIIDCTDNVKTRYTLSDYCKIEGKHMILASVLKWEGQVFILPKIGPCYRCLFPEPKENAQNCDEAGVIGPVCGIIGSIQATETLKLILDIDSAKSTLIVYDALKNKSNNFDLSQKSKKDCIVCEKREYSNYKIPSSSAHPPMMEKINPENKIKWKVYLENKNKYILIDVRPEIYFKICRIKDSVNIKLDEILQTPEIVKKYNKKSKKIAIICKRGATARKVANMLLKNKIECFVIEGGLQSFKNTIDSTFPLE